MDSLDTYRDFLKAYWWKERDKNPTDLKKKLPPPLTQKPVPENAETIELVHPNKFTVGGMPLLEAVRSRKSHRRFTEESLSLEELSFLLWTTQGLRDTGEDGSISRRTVPSAGARHPFETYLIVNRVNELDPGLYRYIPLEHKLLFIYTDAELPEKVSQGCRNQIFVGQGAVVFIWTVIPYRAEWRFSVVAPKMIAMDAGHLCQNLYLASEAIGAGTCAIGAYDQDKMDAIVEVDGEEEFVIYAAPVGKVQ
jgi:SagB-type dehydrogenase family enzyme